MLVDSGRPCGDTGSLFVGMSGGNAEVSGGVDGSHMTARHITARVGCSPHRPRRLRDPNSGLPHIAPCRQDRSSAKSALGSHVLCRDPDIG